MQYPEKSELVDPSALSTVPLAEHRSAAAVGQTLTPSLHFAVLSESLKEEDFCTIEEAW